ncbi:MAG: phosphonoacetaldehyde hydrolase [Pirellula sp.]|nr:phosphonoacetaldehyde hydrolase [Pirellula sp.]
MSSPGTKIQAALFDWAGTTIDYGSLAPMRVFVEIFRRRGVEIAIEEARGPMGRAKHEHIAEVCKLPRVAMRWREVHGREPGEADVMAMYEEFLPLQKSVLGDGWELIPGVLETMAALRSRGILIGSTTGYTRALMEVVAPRAARLGYSPDCIVCSDDVKAGRPAPWMNFRAAELIGIFPPSAIVAVDDTPVGIEAARNGGMWAVGVARTGNEFGFHEAEADALQKNDALEYQRRLAIATDRLKNAGAHFVVDGIADLVDVVDAVEKS